jgi:serine/threonine-protein kinase
MERLEGVTLEGLLRAEGRLSPEQALDLLEPVCSALDAAHHAGAIHRDVKASNIFVVRGPPRSVKLLDFGIAKLMEPERTGWLTTAGRAPGTLTIMAPEQILGGPLDARVDVYALGVLLHRLLTGALPFYSKNATELARQHLEEPPPRPSQWAPLTPALDAIVLRCLEKEPERRFGSVKSFLWALREAVGEPEVGRGSSPDAPAEAVAVHVELRLRADLDDIDDALADHLGGLLDLTEERLRAAGLAVVSTGGEEILGMRVLDGSPADAGRGRQAVAEVAADLVEAVARRGGDGRVHVNVCMHAGPVLVRTMLKPEIVGGPLARAGEWTPRQDVPGLCATREAAGGLTGFEIADGPGDLVVLRRGDGAREGDRR